MSDDKKQELLKAFLDTPEEEISIGRYCTRCSMPLPSERKRLICASCAETELFIKVREYINKNDVTEFEVASHFRIPLRVVKKWIIEGRIEYKNRPEELHNCVRCGRIVRSGNYCQSCIEAERNSDMYDAEEMEELRKQVVEDMIQKQNFE